EDLLDLARGLLEETGRRRHRSPHAHHAGAAMIREEPRGVETMMARGGAEVPHPRIAVAGKERIADDVVARPLACYRAGDVADVVLVEHEQGAQSRARERAADPGEAVVVEPPEIHALLEVHLHVPRSLDGAVPAMLRIRRLGHGVLVRCGSWLASHGVSSLPSCKPPSPPPPSPPRP